MVFDSIMHTSIDQLLVDFWNPAFWLAELLTVMDH